MSISSMAFIFKTYENAIEQYLEMHQNIRFASLRTIRK
jgi:hypothetical protein